MKKKIGITVAVIMLLIGSAYGLYRYCYPDGIYRYYYPYGSDHRCNKILYFVLREYAEKHDGYFPSGEKTPEASLSLIHSLDGSGSENAYLLHRRDVSEEDVQQILKSGQLLGPETCGWNYIEGLRIDSNPELALFWDKEGLSEIGERLAGGGHWVNFVDGGIVHISASEWDGFIEKQRNLLAKEKNKIKENESTLNTLNVP